MHRTAEDWVQTEQALLEPRGLPGPVVGLDGSISRLRLVVNTLHDTLDAFDTVQAAKLAGRLRQVMNVLPAVLLVLDRQGHICDSNPAALDLLGEALAGRSWRELLSAKFRYCPTSGELLTKDARHFAVTTQALPDDDGQLVLLVDVTELRQLQRRSERQSRLEILGEMFTRLAHQIASPLSTIRLCIDEFSESGLQNINQNSLRRANSAVEHLLALVHELQYFVVGGNQKTQIVGVRELLSALKKNVLPRIKKAGAKLKISYVPVANLRISVNLVVSALTNLIDNALQAKPTGLRVTMAISTSPQMLTIKLIDNGPGIAPELQSRVFEPFFSTREQGTGLGLAITRSLLQSSGGNIELEPSCNTGCCFVITLPISQEA